MGSQHASPKEGLIACRWLGCGRQDWGEYKEDKGVIDELETFKKSGATYTEKMAFLNKADFREYERERDARLAAHARKS